MQKSNIHWANHNSSVRLVLHPNPLTIALANLGQKSTRTQTEVVRRLLHQLCRFQRLALEGVVYTDRINRQSFLKSGTNQTIKNHILNFVSPKKIGRLRLAGHPLGAKFSGNQTRSSRVPVQLVQWPGSGLSSRGEVKPTIGFTTAGVFTHPATAYALTR